MKTSDKLEVLDIIKESLKLNILDKHVDSMGNTYVTVGLMVDNNPISTVMVQSARG